jgi:hypothetical protein
MKALIRSVRNGSRILYYTGLLHLFLALVFMILSGFDARIINDESIWLKPFRFAVSIFLFTWTYAWFTNYLESGKKIIAALNHIIALCMFIEIALISMQSIRGVASHFNVSTPFDATVFSVMGAVIGFNAFVMGIWFVIFVFFNKGGGQYRSSIIWGMFLFLLGNLAGYFIIRYGWPNPAAGMSDSIQITGWKTSFKDLRIPHAIGLHAIQALPFSMWLIIKTSWPENTIHAVGATYLALYLVSMVVALG